MAHKSQTCAPESIAAASSGVRVMRSSALFGTGPSYTEQISEMDAEGGEDGEKEEEEEGGKKKKKKSGGEKEKVGGQCFVVFIAVPED